MCVCRYPFAAPHGQALQHTKRVTRYWALHDQVAAATAAAVHPSSSSLAAPGQHQSPGLQDSSSQLPSLLQASALALHLSA